jgi:hypothetical protein
VRELTAQMWEYDAGVFKVMKGQGKYLEVGVGLICYGDRRNPICLGNMNGIGRVE